jgi:hypothetical protein
MGPREEDYLDVEPCDNTVHVSCLDNDGFHILLAMTEIA